MEEDLKEIKKTILEVLAHPEASDGLYFRNFYNLHEEDERPVVSGTQEEILEAISALIREGEIVADESGEEVIFFLNS